MIEIAKENILKNKVLITLITLDILIIVLHILFGYNYSFFHVDKESNLPTAYQGLKLLALGLYFLFIYFTLKSLSLIKTDGKKEDLFWIFVSTMFIFIGVDELTMIHENIKGFMEEINPELVKNVDNMIKGTMLEGSFWVVYYAPFFIGSVPIFIFQFFYLLKRVRWQIYFFIFGVVFLIFVPIIETYNTSLLNSNTYNFWVTIEELFEMLGITFISYGYFYFIQEKTTSIYVKKQIKKRKTTKKPLETDYAEPRTAIAKELS